jgi:cytochrome c peroxidase
LSSRRARLVRSLIGIAAVASIAACRGRGAPPSPAARPSVPAGSATAQSFYAQPFSRKPTVPAMTELGRKLFFDPTLSASGQMSCATCHDPRFGYGPPNALSTQLGGPDLKSPGVRAVPSLRYLNTLPAFTEHTFDEAVDESVDQGPTGGHGWDGRAGAAHDQARLPLTSPFEMANPSVDSVVEKVARGPAADEFRKTFGDDVFADPKRATTAVLLSIEVFEQSPKDFYPYSSRYDAWLRRKGELTRREQRGLALFNDPRKGNCASCHPSGIRNGAFPQFTDFGFQAVGAPRNRTLAVNDDPAFYDMGLCGPQRTDLSSHKEYCGEFRVPTLRNVTRRHAFFHNGVFHRLDEVLAFYVERDTKPEKWYPKKGGHVDAFDDLPVAFRKNVNREPPFGGTPSGVPALSRGEIGDVIAFLETLTDADVASSRQ